MSDTIWTRRLQVLTVACAVVFLLGTAAQAFLVIDDALVAHAMRLAGRSASEAEQAAPGFVTALRATGVAYLVGNAVGLLALTGRTWVFVAVLVVNASQAAGVVAGLVPAVVLAASYERLGVPGLLPTLVTDGGAALLTLVLVGFLVRYRTPWARRRVTSAAGPRPGPA